MSRFRLSPGGRHPHEPWFHIGALEVTTTWFVVLLSIVAVIVFAVAGVPPEFMGGGSRFEMYLVHWPALWPYEGAKPWTILTWPFGYGDFSFWDALTIFFFWYFGQDLEGSLLGRKRLGWMLAIWTVILGVSLYVFDQLNSSWGTPLYGLGLLQLMVVLLWTAEWPGRMFFFNIPAWVFGVVIAAIQVVQYLGHRQWDILLTFLLGVVLCGFVARQFGALSEYAWIPKVSGRRPRRPKKARSSGRGYSSGGTVVPGPWQNSSVNQRDEDRMNELLDKIHLGGVDSLSAKEKAELNELRLRRRRS